VLAGLRYNEAVFLKLLGGRDTMIESPVLQELKAEWTREVALEAARKATLEAERRTIVDFLAARFDSAAESAAEGLGKIDDQATLKKLVGIAARCPDLDTFLKELGEIHQHG